MGATISTIFLRMNLPNFVQFKQYEGQSGQRVISFGGIAFPSTTRLQARSNWSFNITWRMVSVRVLCG